MIAPGVDIMSDAIKGAIIMAVCATVGGTWLANRPAVIADAVQTAQPQRANAGSAGSFTATPAGVAATYGRVEIEADRRGQFHAEVEVNGRPIAALVDTGATTVLLRAEDAAALGFRPSEAEYRYKGSTANGESTLAAVVLREVRVGGLSVYDVQAFIARPHAVSVTLLGMSYLRKLKGFEIGGDRLVLKN